MSCYCILNTIHCINTHWGDGEVGRWDVIACLILHLSLFPCDPASEAKPSLSATRACRSVTSFCCQCGCGGGVRPWVSTSHSRDESTVAARRSLINLRSSPLRPAATKWPQILNALIPEMSLLKQPCVWHPYPKKPLPHPHHHYFTLGG